MLFENIPLWGLKNKFGEEVIKGEKPSNI